MHSIDNTISKSPCGSGKRLRNCHGNIVLDIINSGNLEIYKDNYRRIKNVGRI